MQLLELSEKITRELNAKKEVSGVIQRLVNLVESGKLDSFHLSITDSKEFFHITGKLNITVYLKNNNYHEKALLGKKAMSLIDKAKENTILGSNFANKATEDLKSELVSISDTIVIINDLLSAQLTPLSDKFYFSKNEVRLPDFFKCNS